MWQGFLSFLTLLAHAALGPLGLCLYGPLAWVCLLLLSAQKGAAVDSALAGAAFALSTAASLFAHVGLSVVPEWLLGMKWLALVWTLKALRSPTAWCIPIPAENQAALPWIGKPCAYLATVVLMGASALPALHGSLVDFILHVLRGCCDSQAGGLEESGLPASPVWRWTLSGALAIGIMCSIPYCFFICLLLYGSVVERWGWRHPLEGL